MKRLIVDHSYNIGMAWDRSQYRNHGVLHYTPRGSGALNQSLSFARGRTAPGSCVIVPPSKSMANLGAVRVRAVINTNHTGTKRQNIVEGDHAFAFFANGDFSLQGTFLDPQGKWVGIRSPAHILEKNRWYEVEFWYDGISQAEIHVSESDGAAAGMQRVAHSFDSQFRQNGKMRGPVRGVGPKGIFIGHWPAADDRYTFDGHIRSVKLFKRDEFEKNPFADPCCQPDVKKWMELAEKMKRSGFDIDKIRQIQGGLQSLVSNIIGDLHGDDEGKAEKLNHLINQFMLALKNRNAYSTTPAFEALAEQLSQGLHPGQVDKLRDGAEEIIDAVPLSRDEILKLGDELCFSGFRRDVDGFVKRTRNDPQWEKARKRFKHRPH
jgi:hypothetical protein